MSVAIPRYLNTSSLGRRLGVTATSVANWRRRYPPGSTILPTPAPDAWEETARGYVPLWHEQCVPAWETWQTDHTKLVADWYAARPTLRTGSST